MIKQIIQEMKNDGFNRDTFNKFHDNVKMYRKNKEWFDGLYGLLSKKGADESGMVDDDIKNFLSPEEQAQIMSDVEKMSNGEIVKFSC